MLNVLRSNRPICNASCNLSLNDYCSDLCEACDDRMQVAFLLIFAIIWRISHRHMVGRSVGSGPSIKNGRPLSVYILNFSVIKTARSALNVDQMLLIGGWQWQWHHMLSGKMILHLPRKNLQHHTIKIDGICCCSLFFEHYIRTEDLETHTICSFPEGG